MNFRFFLKLIKLIRNPYYLRCLIYGVAAGVEHEKFLRTIFSETIVDIGANRGQFSVVSRYLFPKAFIFAFEPQSEPAIKFKKIFSTDDNVKLFETAIAEFSGKATLHISAQDDSSSLLPITKNQARIFPGTHEVGTQAINVMRLSKLISLTDITGIALLKIDVQGSELDVLKGAEDMLHRFKYIYIECSFVELYKNQALADEIEIYLKQKKFKKCGEYNRNFDINGNCVQADIFYVAEH